MAASTGTALRCLDGPDGCQGPVQPREPLSGTGKSFPRCDHHWDRRIEKQREIRQRYPTLKPNDFDPTAAGERWDEDEP